VVVNGNSGKTAYFAGPDVLYVDLLGIADALMARLPDRDGKLEMSGHLYRAVPLAYVEARRSGSLEGLDAHLRAWYEPMQQIVSGPLFSAERLKAIWNMNTGAYDAELRAYIADMPNQAMYQEPKG
jgi:arabinofuranosyltransferase